MIRSRHGFTMIEIVIAILITAIIVTTLGVILRSTVDAKILVESEARARRLGPNIMATISRDLRNAWATGPVEGVEIDGNWFRGQQNGSEGEAEDEVYFVTSVDSYMKYEGVSSDLTEVGYFLRENRANDDNDPLAGLYSLYRREDFSVDKRQDEGGLGIKLHDRVVSFRVWFYRVPDDAVDETGYVDIESLAEVVAPGSSYEETSWDGESQSRLPYAVRVELILDATPIDAYNRNQKKRYAVYETLVRLPDYPDLEEDSQLFAVDPPDAPEPVEEGEGDGEGDGSGEGNGEGNGDGDGG